MDAALTQRIHLLLAGRESKRDKTLDAMQRTFRRMDNDGFDFNKFQSSAAEAQQEGDRYLAWLRTQPPMRKTPRRVPGQAGRGGATNVIKNLKALARLLGYKDIDWHIPHQRAGRLDVYTLDELTRLLRIPYSRSEGGMLERAAVECHLALGWRVDEHVPLEDREIDPTTCTVLLSNPEKGNPVRRLPVEPPFFAGADGKPGSRGATMAWLRHRPVWQPNPRRVWVYTDARGVVRPMTGQKFAEILAAAGKKVGVRANCTRGRHTRCMALVAQVESKTRIKHPGSNLDRGFAFVMFWMGHKSIQTLMAYIEQLTVALAAHLRKPTWFCRKPTNTE